MSAPWLAGGRVAAHVLEQRLASLALHESREAAATRAMRRCERVWRAAADTLGPASGASAVWEWLLRPLAEELGWMPESGAAITVSGVRVRVAQARLGDAGQLLVATPWGASLDGLQRAATRLAARQGHAWVAVCNGVHWRWHDVARPYARDHVSLTLAHGAVDGRVWQTLWQCGQVAPARQGPASAQAWLDRLATESAAANARAAGALRREVSGVMDTLALHARGGHDAHLAQVFQWLFLLFADARMLVPSWHPAYARSYSLPRLLPSSGARAPAGIHDGVTAITALGSRGGRLGSLQVPALNGALFQQRLEARHGRRLPDRVVGRMIARLAGAGSHSGTPVDLSSLDVEHLGALYEHLMAPGSDAQPALLRKRTGAFYTPRAMADQLVARTLDPLVAEASADEILALRIVDPAMGSGALLASALRYLVRAVEAAWVREGRGGPLDVPREDREALPRRIAEQCLYGVDVNARAVQVARLSLWLLSLAPDRPLTWLDAHIRAGDSLVGVSPDRLLARPPVRAQTARPSRDEGQLTLFDLQHWHHEAATLGSQFRALAARPSLTADDVREKARRFSDLRDGDAVTRWRSRADAWCGAAMDDAQVTAAMWRAVDDALRESSPECRASARVMDLRDRWLAAASSGGCLHWALEFPEVFDDGRGGFDAVVANPPWEMLRGDLGSGDDRAAHRADVARLQRFVQRSGLYKEVTGHLNTYQLFVERMLQLVRPGGRIGCLLPGSMLADAGAAGLRRQVFDHAAIDRLAIVDNREGLFPIHRSMRIVAMTGSAGGRTDALLVEVDAPPRRRPDDATARASQAPPDPVAGVGAHLVSRDLLRAASGAAEAIPHLRTPADLSVLAHLVRWPRLADPPWGLRFGRELNATDDRHRLAPDGQGELIVVDGKHLRAFGVCPPADAPRATAASLARVLPARPWERWRVAYRDVSSPTNTRSLIAALLPPWHVSTHTLACLREPLPLAQQLYLCGMLNSLVADWFVRRYLGAHVTSRLIGRLPVPRPPATHPDRRMVVRLAGRLARNPADHVADVELQAVAVRLYGLSREAVDAVIADFPRLAPTTASRMRDASG
ncbi:hypothetical protein TBR22_A50500 [Luteitalea sp. TBR-22]|uniref:Eco57I restriction-modification methylase domain-containing protein n=1 Tax=Luteitalea sp. TBR-22 TaxID=2802971 RepID=UPI001AF361BF|nr:N-6 DNA methylase [Luteitalea sp. TBR-22]BCS35816.1 hypothetical protein TBR22_A50500 [Luteitalea sp. TBR-22]